MSASDPVPEGAAPQQTPTEAIASAQAILAAAGHAWAKQNAGPTATVSYIAMAPIAAAAAPAGSLFVDSADSIAKYKDGAGTLHALY